MNTTRIWINDTQDEIWRDLQKNAPGMSPCLAEVKIYDVIHSIIGDASFSVLLRVWNEHTKSGLQSVKPVL